MIGRIEELESEILAASESEESEEELEVTGGVNVAADMA